MSHATAAELVGRASASRLAPHAVLTAALVCLVPRFYTSKHWYRALGSTAARASEEAVPFEPVPVPDDVSLSTCVRPPHATRHTPPPAAQGGWSRPPPPPRLFFTCHLLFPKDTLKISLLSHPAMHQWRSHCHTVV